MEGHRSHGDACQYADTHDSDPEILLEVWVNESSGRYINFEAWYIGGYIVGRFDV